MPAALRKPRSGSNFAFVFLALPLAALIGFALWMAAASAYENVKFAHATGKILSLVALARDDAAREPAFGTTPGEDLLATLVRRAQISSDDNKVAMMLNAWGGDIRLVVAQPSLMRLETDLPARDCRRLARFFDRDAAGLGLEKMDAREAGSSWRQFYAAGTRPGAPSAADVNAACGQAEPTSLALTLKLR